MSTTREAILKAVADLIASDPLFPHPAIDEPEPSRWVKFEHEGRVAHHAVAVQDGPPPDHLAFARGAEGDPLDELELEAAVAYAVRVDHRAGDTLADVRAERRKLRDAAVTRVANLIGTNRNLGLSVEVWAEVGPAQREDEVAFENAPATATAIIPVRVLYTAAHAAD